MSSHRPDLTMLLNRAASGDRRASEELLPLVYDELRKLARHRMSHLPAGQTMQATALVHEAYMRVVDRADEGWEGRRHFFFVAARAMRDILVDEARRKAAHKRGGDLVRVDLGDTFDVAAPADDMLCLDESLSRLEAADPEGYELVMLRYFTGLTVNEVAESWGQSVSSVERKWRFVRAWLARSMDGAA